MKLIFPILLLIICNAAFPQLDCRCRKATEEEDTLGGHIANEYVEDTPLRSVHGEVQEPYGSPLGEALVEVFADSGDDRTPTSRNRKRVAACISGADGKFCFKGLRAGKYILAVSARGFNMSYFSITLNPKNRRSTKEGLDIKLQPGT